MILLNHIIGIIAQNYIFCAFTQSKGDENLAKLDKDYEFPLYIFHQGKNYKAYEFFGCHRIKGDIAMDLFFSLNIGVIGGADGPTAIFVSGGPSVWFWVGVGITVVAAVGLFVYWFQKRK